MKLGVWPQGFLGHRGSIEHDAIVDWTRFDLAQYVRDMFPRVDWSFIYADALIALEVSGKALSKHGRAGRRFPDGLWLFDQGRILIEVGHFDLDKIEKNEIILHISFDGKINLVNPRDGIHIEIWETVKFFMETQGFDSYPLNSNGGKWSLQEIDR